MLWIFYLLEETRLLEYKPASTPIEANMDLWFDERHRRLIEKLIYLRVTRPDITFVVRVLSRFIHQPREVH